MTESIYSKLLEKPSSGRRTPPKPSQAPRGTSKKTGKIALKEAKTSPQVKEASIPYPTGKTKKRLTGVSRKKESEAVSRGVRTYVQVKKEKVRYPFDFYYDQISKLKEMRRQALIRGGEFSMSAFVREAVEKALRQYVRTGGK